MIATPAALLDTCLKATLVLGLAALAVRALHQGSAATRHLVWTLAVLAVLILPPLRALAPEWEVPLLPAVVEDSVPETARRVVAPAIVAPLARESAHVPPAPATLPAGAATQPTDAAAPTAPPFRLPLSPARLAWITWFAGALGVVFPLLVGAIRVARLGRRSTPLASSAWSSLLEEIRADLGLTRPVRLLRGEAAGMPMAWGVLRPAVLLPEDAEEWPEARRRAVLTHELAHVKRHDCLTQALAHFACALYWFHPLVWVAARRLRSEREVACDDLVLRSGASGPDYADHLLHLARSFRTSRHPVWATVAMARPSQLEGRLLAILDPSLDRRGPSRLAAALTLALVAAVLIPLAGLRPWASSALAAQSPAEFPSSTTPRAREAEVREQTARAQAEGAAEAVTQKAALAQGVAEAVAETMGQAESIAQARAEETPASALGAPHTERVVTALTSALSDSDDEVRREAVGALGQLRAQSAAGPLTAALADKDNEVRAQAAFALGQLRSSAAAEALGRALRSDTTGEVRAQAAFALGQIRAESAVAPLVAALSDAEAEVRQQAVFALGQIRAASSVDGLIAALRDANGEVRQQAAFALGQIREPRTVAPLASALGDQEAEVRQQVVFALGQIRAAEAAGPLGKALKDADAEVRQQAAFALGQIRSHEAIPALIAALGDTSSEVRQQAAFALGQMRDERAADALTAALKDKDADVRRQAAFALGQLTQ